MEAITCACLLDKITELEQKITFKNGAEISLRKNDLLEEQLDGLYAVWGMFFGAKELRDKEGMLTCVVCKKKFTPRGENANNDICGKYACRSKYKQN